MTYNDITKLYEWRAQAKITTTATTTTTIKKKKKKIYQQNNSSESHFKVFFLPRLALQDYNLRLPNPMFYGGRENTTKNFPFSF